MHKSRYDGLDISIEALELLESNPEQFKSYCNGVGSNSGGFFSRLLYHITPNTIWGLSITDCSDIHDVEYSYPKTFLSFTSALDFKACADLRFLYNMKQRINARGGFFRKVRLERAAKYYYAVCKWGEKPFIKGKSIL